jgi:hypothetical protein
VATDLPTHTQSISHDIPILAPAEAAPFAAALQAATGPRGREVAERALAYCRQRYTVERFNELVAEAVAKAVPQAAARP